MFAASQSFALRPGHTWVKVCGLTCPADAELAIKLGADALGFNFYPGSMRCLDLASDAAWIRQLPMTVQKVAVTVNPTHEQIDGWREAGVADVIQLHGDEDEDFCQSLQAANVPFVKAIRARDEAALMRPDRFRCSYLLIDAYHPHSFGGTGQQMDWELAARFVISQSLEGRQVILSGGLTPENVSEAIQRVHPAGVDVASGVEGKANPRRKDAVRLQEFFEAVRAASA